MSSSPKRSAKVTILSVLLGISILMAAILAVFCIRQQNILRYKSIVNLSTAYSYMQDFYLAKDDSHKESFSKLLLAMESQSDYLDNTALRVKEFVRLSALSATKDDRFDDVSAIIRTMDVNFDTENKTVIVDLDNLNNAIELLSVFVK